MPMHHLHCRICPEQIIADDLSGVVAGYLTHVIAEHWDMVQTMHDRPDLVTKAHEMAREYGWEGAMEMTRHATQIGDGNTQFNKFN